MTQEEKQLLLKDLCARLPYGLKVNIRDIDHPAVVQAIYSDLDVLVEDMHRYSLLFECKPYLRPMSSMTEEEKEEYNKTRDKILVRWDYLDRPAWYEYSYTIKTFDWLYAHHFDFRWLIPEGLALEAPEGMYTKEDEI